MQLKSEFDKEGGGMCRRHGRDCNGEPCPTQTVRNQARSTAAAARSPLWVTAGVRAHWLTPACTVMRDGM